VIAEKLLCLVLAGLWMLAGASRWGETSRSAELNRADAVSHFGIT